VAPKAPSVFSKFDEAIEWFLARIVLARGEFDAISDRAKRQAFTVSNLSSLRMVDQVFREIGRALMGAEGMKSFRKRMIPMMDDDWGQGRGRDAAGRRINVGARLETIYRTNVLGAYNDGRHEQMSEPVVKKFRPYWMYDAIMDSRTTSICKGRDGKVFAADDPWWNTNYPPLHYNCRSGVRALTAKQALRRGVASPADLWSKDKEGNIVPAGDPLAGFGNTPDIGAKAVAQADMSKVNDALVNIYNEKQARTIDK
jgi:SPP1 gp7 family putative phage head morphogenesis protein